MADSLLVNVPSNEIIESGYQQYIRLFNNQKEFKISQTLDDTTHTIDDAIYEPISGCLIQSPRPIDESGLDADILTKWTSTPANNIFIIDRCETRKGIQIKSANSPTGWSVESTTDIVEYNRGFFIDFMVAGPPTETNSNSQLPFVVEWGTFADGQDGESDVYTYKWRLEISTNEKGMASAKVLEHNKSYDANSATTWDEWFVADQFTLINKDYFNNNHRIWIEPINDKQFLIKNAIGDLGVIITQKQESQTEVALPSDEEGSTYVVSSTWNDSKIKFSGNMISWMTYRQLEYKHYFSLTSIELTTIGYASTQDFTRQYKYWAPDGLTNVLTGDSDYLIDWVIYNESNALWTAGVGGTSYYFVLLSTAPEDSVAGYSKRSVKLSDLRLRIEKLYGSNGLVATDLFAYTGICVESLSETRTREDLNDTLSFDITGKMATFNALGFPKANARVQWRIDTEPGSYVRFDGYIDSIEASNFIDFNDNTYYMKYNIKCKNRWKDAQRALFRGSYALDSMTRTEVYQLLADQMELPPGELSIGSLLNDIQMQNSNPGEEPLLITKVGTDVYSAFREMQKYYSVEDRMYWRDDGTGSQNVKLFITDADYSTVKETFYRDALTAESNGSPTTVIASIDGNDSPMQYQINDRDFYNDFFIMGYEDKKPVMAHFSYPPSWGTPSNPLYIRKRRMMLKINPAWNSQSIVNLVGYSLFKKYMRMQVPTTISSFLMPNLYPDDIVSIDPGGEPGASIQYYRIIGMRSSLRKTFYDATRRYSCQYDLELL